MGFSTLPQMSPLVTTALTVLRNVSNTEDWFTFSQHLNALVRESFTLGLLDDRELLDQLQFRGDTIEQGGHPAAVLRVFSEILPNKRHVSRETTFRDRGKLHDINKLHSASTAVSGAAHGYPIPSHLAAHHAARVAASSTAPQPRGRGSSVRGGDGRYSSAGTFGLPAVHSVNFAACRHGPTRCSSKRICPR
ncbi:unnamed protein product [Pylaiella littoralis]